MVLGVTGDGESALLSERRFCAARLAPFSRPLNARRTPASLVSPQQTRYLGLAYIVVLSEPPLSPLDVPFHIRDTNPRGDQKLAEVARFIEMGQHRHR